MEDVINYSTTPIEPKNRICGDCKLCCDGTMAGKALGHVFYRGRPCHFLGDNGCTIYESRPHDPCRTFKCEWLKDDGTQFPDWMKPNQSGIIMTKRRLPTGDFYYAVIESGRPMQAKYLAWIFQKIIIEQCMPCAIQVDGGWNYFGPPDLVQLMIDEHRISKVGV